MSRWIWRIRARIDDTPAHRKIAALICAFIAVQVIIWAGVFEILWYANRSITDMPVYYNYAGRIVRGMFPYRDFSLEYPPLGVLFITLPRIFSGSSYALFVVFFQTEMLLLSSGTVILLAALAWRQWQSVRQVGVALALYCIFLLSLGAIVKLRFDLAAAFIILASIACYIRDRRMFAWMLLGAGFMTKAVPLLIAPLFLIMSYRREQKRDLWLGPLAAFLTAIAIALPFLIRGSYGLANSFLYHAERPLQLESTWASPLLILHSLGATSLKVLNSYGSHNVFATGAGLLATLSGPVTGLLLIAGYYLFFKCFSGREPKDQAQQLLVRFAVIAIATFIFGGKVFSPQFLIWILPLMPLIAGRGRWPAVAVFLAVLLLTQWEFPARYWNLFTLERGMILLVAARDALMAVLAAVLLFPLTPLIKGRKNTGSAPSTGGGAAPDDAKAALGKRP